MFDDAEFFKHAELGWTSKQGRIFLDNVHVTAWHADARERARVKESWGLAFSAAKFICDKWMPFLRGGFSEGNAAAYDRSISVGVGYHRTARGDLAAIGFNVGRPNGLPDWDQYTLEAFYRFQADRQLAITPSLQILGNPAASSEDLVVLLGLRVRMTF